MNRESLESSYDRLTISSTCPINRFSLGTDGTLGPIFFIEEDGDNKNTSVAR
jgi:hypothetical protein